MDSREIVNVEEEDEVEKDWEDWCFICKDGGELVLCEFKGCRKAYHADCIEDDIPGRGKEETFICRRHSCYLCNGKPMLCCLCCPHAACVGCFTEAEFIRYKENKGLCNQCHEMVVMLEEIRAFAPNEEKIDLTDPNTFEGLLLEYWDIVKKDEDITFEDVQDLESERAAKSRDKRKKHFGKKGFKPKHKDDPRFSPSDHEVEHVEDHKTVGKKKKMEFIGWGSKPLIDFLTSIGEDTREAMSQHSLESVIRKYIRKENLLDLEKKKKKVCCDEKLYSIFRKKSLSQNRIYKLLDRHLKENVEQLEYLEHLERGFGEKNEQVLMPCKKQKTERSDEQFHEKEEEICEEELKPEMRGTGLATISIDNIKLVYLRKSLVIELVQQYESFEEKLVGCFVKVKNDPRDSIAYQILQVTGIKYADCQSEGVFIYVAGMANEISISKLDDSDISKEEIEDLKQKVMTGLLRQPTVVEMEQKAKSLHENITKHWIAKQLVTLQKRINYANEKGWRRELEEYLEQRELLKKPSEQERLITETPKIIEDFVEIKQENVNSGLSQEAVITID